MMAPGRRQEHCAVGDARLPFHSVRQRAAVAGTRLLYALAAAILLVPSPSGAPIPEDSKLPGIEAPGTSCRFCHLDWGVPSRRLFESDIDSIGRDISRRNHEVFIRADSLYRAGRFGPRGDRETRRRARNYFQLRAETALDHIGRLSAQADTFFVTDQHAMLRPFGELYSSTAVYPLRFLSRGIVGPGGFCMEYSIPRRHRGEILQGGIPLVIRDDTVKTPCGDRVHILSLELRSDLHSTMNLLYEERFCGLVYRETVVDRGDTLDLLIIDQIQGLYVQRAGVHRMQAILSWRNRVKGDRVPDNPRIGAYVYLPAIRIELPLFLPSLGLHDLRIFSLPQPIIRIDGFGQWVGQDAEWINLLPGFGFTPWEPYGPIPDVINERYPDL